jgi:hypothetical protein
LKLRQHVEECCEQDDCADYGRDEVITGEAHEYVLPC